MRNEMDLLNMDERQRLAWFMANRGTVIAVGAVWLGMIGWELTHGRVPAFLLITEARARACRTIRARLVCPGGVGRSQPQGSRRLWNGVPRPLPIPGVRRGLDAADGMRKRVNIADALI